MEIVEQGIKMSYWVYMLMCHKNGKFTNFYVGQTNDIEARMEEHFDNVRNGYTDSYTGRFDFVKLVWKWKVYTRLEALELERGIKDLDHSEKWDLIKGRIKVKDI
tara:strand:- start:24 stop:338 length:315 start_codon:yes stop_codon:yes gene_type:complete